MSRVERPNGVSYTVNMYHAQGFAQDEYLFDEPRSVVRKSGGSNDRAWMGTTLARIRQTCTIVGHLSSIRVIIITLCAILSLAFFTQMRWALARFFIHYSPVRVVQAHTSPTVTLDSATVTGLALGSTNQFLGIPFAQPPTGNLRFQLPQALPLYNTSFTATKFGPACPQPKMSSRSKFNLVTPHFAEDCLTLNVITPADTSPASNLPVLVWVYGGAFLIGGTSLYNGSGIVEKAISLGVPAIYISMNYRMNAFGFLASQEVKDAGVGNLGLHDQRLAFRWVQKYIRAFGGDPAKVTIWGHSAGAMSVAFHMMTNDGNSDGLFRAAIMQSGSTIPIGDITDGQPYYDALVAATGCSGTMDTLQCLRKVPYELLLDVVNQSTRMSVNLAWSPRVDGVFLKANPQTLVQQGSVANIPFITSNCDDEGTVFSFLTLNITTDAQFEEHIHTYFVPNASPAELTQLLSYYPSDPAYGSPFGTGNKNALTPQFKRIAAFHGDFTFQAPRRFFIQNLSGKQNIWTYVSKRGKSKSPVGAAHGSDLTYIYGGGDIASYLLRFVTNLDPNVGEVTGSDLYWPQYDATFSPIMLEFLDGFIQQELTMDTYRAEAIAYLINLVLTNQSSYS